MSASGDLTALSFLPIQWWRDVGALLRAGRPAGEILEQQIAVHARYSRCAADLRQRAELALASAVERGIQTIGFDDARYPPALAAVVDAPPVLWLRGAADALGPPAVAIVGSRAGSSYALMVAEKLAADIAARGVTVVSGLARGVDAAAHRGALSVAGATVAVLGSGADVVYPAEHRQLAGEIVRAGALVTELAPGTPPLPEFFPRRNRIISGLSRAVVIVEAGEKSGSLITARSALEQGRDVLAVPGNVLNGRNRGGHSLMKDGAKIVECADDIFEEIGLPAGAPAKWAGDSSATLPTSEAAEDRVMASVTAGEASDLDSIAERSGLTVERLLPRLLDLELAGRIRRVGGGRFARIDSSC